MTPESSAAEILSRLLALDPAKSVSLAAIETLHLALESSNATTVNQLNKELSEIVSGMAKTDYSSTSIRSASDLFRSRVVLEALCHSHNTGVCPHIWVTESQPDASGRMMCDELKKKGLKSTLVLDSAVGLIFEIFLCKSIMIAKLCFFKIGTLNVAICAKTMNKPVYVMAESIKFVKEYPLNQADIPEEFKVIGGEEMLSTSSYSRSQGDSVSQTEDNPRYLDELVRDMRQLNHIQITQPGVFRHAQSAGDVIENGPITLHEKVLIPTFPSTRCNFIGRILGPCGISVKQLESETECHILIRGAGSVKDVRRESRLRGQAGWEHLSEPLHVLVTATDMSRIKCETKLRNAVQSVTRLLTPQHDDYKRKQLVQLAIINGTYRQDDRCYN
uniref:Translation initiation factor eIF2B subunit alpha n=1 Tax=Heterorhabditis bacteriophora TaxID=37862 RepID=A0A1I7XB14_HETBA